MIDQDDLRGRSIGEFVIRELLDEGGFGRVYRCEQPTLGREAVIKVLQRRLLSHDVQLQRFLREAQLASRLDHPYAAHIYAFGVEERDQLLTSPKRWQPHTRPASGQPGASALASRLRPPPPKRCLNVLDATRIGRRVAQATCTGFIRELGRERGDLASVEQANVIRADLGVQPLTLEPAHGGDADPQPRGDLRTGQRR